MEPQFIRNLAGKWDFKMRDQYQAGDVFQINEKHGRMGWVGAFVMATEIRSWGVIGFVVVVEDHEKQGRAYIRLKWDELDHIGRAPLVPQDEPDQT